MAQLSQKKSLDLFKYAKKIDPNDKKVSTDDVFRIRFFIGGGVRCVGVNFTFIQVKRTIPLVTPIRSAKLM